MAVRRIFVDPGDFIIVHVMQSKETPKTRKEWMQENTRPFKFSLTPEVNGMTFHDSALDVGIRMGSEPRKRLSWTPGKIIEKTS